MAEAENCAGHRLARARIFTAPKPHAAAEISSSTTTPGSNVHAVHKSCGTGGVPSCAKTFVGANTVAAATADINTRRVVMSTSMDSR